MSKYIFRNVIVIAKKEEAKNATKGVMFEGLKDDSFLSIFNITTVKGPNMSLAKGPKDDLLLWVLIDISLRTNFTRSISCRTDYVTWNGANPDIIKGHRVQATGANSSLLIERTYTPRGRSSELCKGPKIGLAKGSMYSQISRPNVACN